MMSKGVKIIIVLWLILLSVTSLIAFFRSFYTEVNLGIDYAGVLVGILAALVTTLIGWQIYTIIDLKSINTRFKELENIRKEGYLKMSLQLYETLSIMTTQIANKAEPKELLGQSIQFELMAIIAESQLGMKEICEMKISNLIQTSSELLEITSFEKLSFLEMVSGVEELKKAKNYNELRQWLIQLQESSLPH